MKRRRPSDEFEGKQFHPIYNSFTRSNFDSQGISLLDLSSRSSFDGLVFALSRRARNKLVYICYGNPFSLRVCNINGLQKDGRREFLYDSTVDFMAITETHANA